MVLLLLLYGTVRVQAARSPPRRGTVQSSCTATQPSLFAQYTCDSRRQSQAPLPLIMVHSTSFLLWSLLTNHARPTSHSALMSTLFPFCAVFYCYTRYSLFLPSQLAQSSGFTLLCETVTFFLVPLALLIPCLSMSLSSLIEFESESMFLF